MTSTGALRRLAGILAIVVAASVWAADVGLPDQSGTSTGTNAAAASQLPALSLPGLDGFRHNLGEWHGKVIVLNFWAAWCAPCQAEIHNFVNYQGRYGERGLQVVGVGIDDERPLHNVQRSLEINYPILVAAPADHRGLLRNWGNSSGVIPYTVVIDRSGRIAYTRRGPMDRDEFDANILPLLD